MDKGLTGLSNLGNTCFLNACIQALNHTHELIQLKKTYDPFIRSSVSDSIILREYEELRNVMMENNGVVSPNKFVHNVHLIAKEKGREIFTGWAQNDITEFLLFMIDCIHNSISRGINVIISGKIEHSTDELAKHCYAMTKEVYAKEYSEIMETFNGIYVSEIWSMDGKTRHSIKSEMFFVLDIPIPTFSDRTTTIYDCFDTFTEPEILEGENAWYNEKTNQMEDIRKRIIFWNFPKVVVVSLKRFSTDGQHKITQLVDFPIHTLDLSKYVAGYNASSYVYELYAVCNHMGGVHGGHYTAFAKRPNDDWFHYNDTQVEKVENPQNVITPMAYCLFYRKKNGAI